MLKRKTTLAALAMAGAVWGGSAQIAQAQKICNLDMAKLTLEPADLCECKVVTTQMLRYIQRQDEFLFLLERLSKECPAFANVLTSLPTATTVPEGVLHRDKDHDTPPWLKPKSPRRIPNDGPDKDPKDKPDVKPDPGGGGEEPNPGGGENPEPGGGENPSPEGCSGGGSVEGGGVNARSATSEGCD